MQRSRLWVSLASATAAAVLPAISCTVSGGSTAPGPAGPQLVRSQSRPAASSAATAVGSPAPEPTRADPEAARLFLENLSQPALAFGNATSPPRVTLLGLEQTVRGEAGGMRAEGAPMAAMLTEGQRATMAVTLAPNECATFVAHGGLGVIELDLFLTTGEKSSLRVLAEDPTSGPIAVIGGRAGCYSLGGSKPVTCELSTRARRGGGLVLVRGFRK